MLKTTEKLPESKGSQLGLFLTMQKITVITIINITRNGVKKMKKKRKRNHQEEQGAAVTYSAHFMCQLQAPLLPPPFFR